MYKKNAITVAVILAIVAALVVFLVTSVFVDDSEERYGQVPAPQSETITEEETAAAPEAPAAVEEDSASAMPENDMAAPAEQADEMETAPEPEPTVSDEQMEQAQPQAEDQASADAEGGEIHIVKAVGLKYDPLVVKIQPGDTVAWENMPTHDTNSLEGLIPEGAEAWHSPLGENYQRTFTVEGIYVYKCTPHIGAGMGGVIIVGNPVNLEAIKAKDVSGAEGRLVRKAIAAAEEM